MSVHLPIFLERGLSSPQQRNKKENCQNFSAAVERSNVAADWKVRAPIQVGISRKII